jgi:predicted nucleic acid-binding Zn ribbon protein
MHLSAARADVVRAGYNWSSPNFDNFWASYERHKHPPLYDVAAGKLMRLVNYKLAPRVALRLYWSPDASGLEGHNSPLDLLGAMWCLLLDAICNNAHHKLCVVCGNHYEVSLVGCREDRQYCSTACRMKKYRQRKKLRRTK